MNDQQLAQFEMQFLAFAQASMTQDKAHDVAHIQRVVKAAKQLCQAEEACLAVVLPAAYLHDCVTVAKNHPDRSKSSLLSADRALQLLQEVKYPSEYFDAIHHAIVAHSFSANVEPTTLEAEIVRDADRLDALGAIGIARCIQVSCSLNVALYASDDPFCTQREPDDRIATVDHFYTKLFKLKEDMRSAAAREEAARRTEFMQAYLKQLSKEI